MHAPPLDLSSTYPLHDLAAAVEAFDAVGRGEIAAYSPVYGRMHNPTVGRFEQALAELEGTESAVAFASGMAALTAALLAVRAHVVAVRPLYGGSDQLLASGLLGIEVSWATPGEIATAVRPDSGLVVLETPQNPTLGPRRHRGGGRGRRPAFPCSSTTRSRRRCSRIPPRTARRSSCTASTKYLGGHGDVIGGIVCGSEEWARRLRRVRVPRRAASSTRSRPSSPTAGLPTLPLRVHAAQEGAQLLAERLAAPSGGDARPLSGAPRRRPVGAARPPAAGPGAMLAFEVAGGLDAAARVMESVRLITPAVSLGATDTLIEHPAGLTHRGVGPEALEAAGITPGLLRLSVGVEDAGDLWDDLAAALGRAALTTAA